ncbi:MAG: type II secretion system protein [Phycisphaerae bacterium]
MAHHIHRAFTLIELLVVIAILALLVSLLVPCLQAARRQAQTVVCSTNLHTMGQGTHLYAADNNNFVPRDYWYWPDYGSPGDGAYAHYFFAWCLSKYVGGKPWPRSLMTDDYAMYAALKTLPVYRCPGVQNKAFVLNYVANGVDFDYYKRYKSYNSGAASRIDDLPGHPSDVLYIAEVNILAPWLTSNSFGIYDLLGQWDMPFNYGQFNPDSRMIRATDRRHFGQTTLVYFDGHASPRNLVASQFPASLLNPLDR